MFVYSLKILIMVLHITLKMRSIGDNDLEHNKDDDVQACERESPQIMLFDLGCFI